MRGEGGELWGLTSCRSRVSEIMTGGEDDPRRCGRASGVGGRGSRVDGFGLPPSGSRSLEISGAEGAIWNPTSAVSTAAGSKDVFELEEAADFTRRAKGLRGAEMKLEPGCGFVVWLLRVLETARNTPGVSGSSSHSSSSLATDSESGGLHV
mmetsp:Transcript_43270/g.67782  ORF Transcript_43270/g.67782 Transcript_43270/m.67782 type:complete len:152 (-) Transcript_43270:775-1230(-)